MTDLNSLLAIRDVDLKGLLENPAVRNVRVLTSNQLAESYGVDSKQLSYNFNHNKDRYLEGKHYYYLQGEDLKKFRESVGSGFIPETVNKLYLWTEAGAMLHAKSINNDTAWNVYNQLVDNYFSKRPERQEQLTEVGVSNEALNRMNNLLEMAMQELRAEREKTERLEMTAVINTEMQEQIREMVAELVAAKSGDNKEKKYINSLTSIIYASYNKHFHLNSYKNTPQYRFDEAIEFLMNWRR